MCQIRRIRTAITDVATSGTFLHRLNDGTEATCLSEEIEFATSKTSYRYISYAGPPGETRTLTGILPTCPSSRPLYQFGYRRKTRFILADRLL